MCTVTGEVIRNGSHGLHGVWGDAGVSVAVQHPPNPYALRRERLHVRSWDAHLVSTDTCTCVCMWHVCARVQWEVIAACTYGRFST